MQIQVLLTFDLHPSDRPADIRACTDWLLDSDKRATYFVPSSMLTDSASRAAIQEAQAAGIVIGSHGRFHTRAEIDALRHAQGDLLFLDVACDEHAQWLGSAPTAFRAPCWTPLTEAAIDRLALLGYQTDSSATPQRLALLSSLPFGKAWTFAPRSPYRLRPDLLEIPTSCLGVPFAIPTFMTLRGSMSRAFGRLLQYEARRFDRLLVLMLHVGDLCRDAPDYWKKPFEIADLIPRDHRGFGVKYLIRETRRPRVVDIVQGVLESIHPQARFVDVEQVAETYKNQTASSVEEQDPCLV